MTEQMIEQNVQDNGPEVECAANNREVLGSTPGEAGQSSPSKDARMPDLRYHDQTPLAKPDNKRLCSELSPMMEESDLTKTVNETIQAVLTSSMPEIMKTIQDQLTVKIKAAVDECLRSLREDITKEVKQTVFYAEERSDLKAKCESEMLESYNRRENVRIIGMPDSTADAIGRVVDLASALDAEVSANDISIAHPLPTKKPGPRPLIVRFSRRVAKVNLLRNKKNLDKFDNLKNVRIFEDMTAPRLKFFNLMKSDNNIEKVWSREGTLHYVKAGADNRVHKINSLYDGGQALGYDFYTVQSCFKDTRVFNRRSQESGS